jgi:hypothetical protein
MWTNNGIKKFQINSSVTTLIYSIKTKFKNSDRSNKSNLDIILKDMILPSGLINSSYINEDTESEYSEYSEYYEETDNLNIFNQSNKFNKFNEFDELNKIEELKRINVI